MQPKNLDCLRIVSLNWKIVNRIVGRCKNNLKRGWRRNQNFVLGS